MDFVTCSCCGRNAHKTWEGWRVGYRRGPGDTRVRAHPPGWELDEGGLVCPPCAEAKA